MGLLNLPNSSLVYINTSIVIYSIEQVPNYFELLEPLWQKLTNNQIGVFSSELILLEALVLPIREADTNLVSDYEQLLLNSNMNLIPISQAILRQAAQLRAITRLKTPDAIHAATALENNCTLFLTNDCALQNVIDLPVVLLNEVMERELD